MNAKETLQQEAEAFAEWIEEKGWFKAVTKKDKWICFATDEEFTTSELYQEKKREAMLAKMEKLTDVLQKVENGKMDSIVAFDIILDLFAVSSQVKPEIKDFLLALRFVDDVRIRQEAQKLLGLYCCQHPAKHKNKGEIMKPHICPVCCGRGLVPVDFYLSQTNELGSITGDEQCRSCKGTGIIWHEDDQYIVGYDKFKRTK